MLRFCTFFEHIKDLKIQQIKNHKIIIVKIGKIRLI